MTTQTTRDAPFGGIGPALISFDCGHGIMQVTSGMTVPLGDDGRASPEQLLVATHYAYNIARGAAILADKWNAAPEYRPIAGTDTDSDPSIVENWYFAVWSYNGFTGPGAKRSNHPMDPVYGAWPRTPYSCGAANDGYGHNRGSYPYQELVWGCATRPPVVDGRQLWATVRSESSRPERRPLAQSAAALELGFSIFRHGYADAAAVARRWDAEAVAVESLLDPWRAHAGSVHERRLDGPDGRQYGCASGGGDR